MYDKIDADVGEGAERSLGEYLRDVAVGVKRYVVDLYTSGGARGRVARVTTKSALILTAAMLEGDMDAVALEQVVEDELGEAVNESVEEYDTSQTGEVTDTVGETSEQVDEASEETVDEVEETVEDTYDDVRDELPEDVKDETPESLLEDEDSGSGNESYDDEPVGEDEPYGEMEEPAGVDSGSEDANATGEGSEYVADEGEGCETVVVSEMSGEDSGFDLSPLLYGAGAWMAGSAVVTAGAILGEHYRYKKADERMEEMEDISK